MAAIITVTEYPSMPNRFRVSSSADKGRGGRPFVRDISGVETAAANAMELAQQASRYCVFAPKKVIDLIPESLRRK